MQQRALARGLSSAFVLSIIMATLSALLFVTPVFAATVTWDGGGGDDNFSTGANWVGDAAPVAGDDLVFDNDTVDFDSETPNNDLVAGTSYNSITFQGSGEDFATITGNAFELVAGITDSSTTAGLIISADVTVTADQTFGDANITGGLVLNGGTTLDLSGSSASITGVVSGAGAVDVNSPVAASFTAANTYSGGLRAYSGAAVYARDAAALGDSSNTVTIDSGAQLGVQLRESNVTIPNNISIGGSGLGSSAGQEALVVAYSFGSGGGASASELPDNGNLTMSGTVTLTADTTFYANAYQYTNSTISFDSLTAGGNELSLSSGSADVTVGGTVQSGPIEKTTLSDDVPGTDVVVTPKQEITLTGERGDVSVYGLLKGTGTVADLNVLAPGTLAPGLSPGCINSNNLTFGSGATYTVEMDGTTACSGYDQTDVTGTVTLGNATLTLVLGTDFEATSDDTFTIINNDGTDAVSGTFNGLSEGDTVTSGEYAFEISYAGGSGNDVVLSVVTAPDTGFMLVDSNPLNTAVITVLLSAAIAGIGYRASRKAASEV